MFYVKPAAHNTAQVFLTDFHIMNPNMIIMGFFFFYILHVNYIFEQWHNQYQL